MLRLFNIFSGIGRFWARNAAAGTLGLRLKAAHKAVVAATAAETEVSA